MVRFLLIRHAHAGHNGGAGSPRLVGISDDPLTPHGRRQVERLQSRLNGGADAAYTSPLRRAAETADGALLRPAHRLDTLREIDCGRLEGAVLSEIEQRHPELWRRHLRQCDDHFRWPGGESYAELRARSLAALELIALRHQGQRVLVFTHAGVIGQIVGSIAGTPPARWSEHRPGNASLTEIEWRSGPARLLRFGDASHLGELAA